MLLRLEVSNHRSIFEPVELSMIAIDEDRPAARRFERFPKGVLPVAGIFGPNASGKSNVLDAIAWLSHAVGASLRGWEEAIPRDPHCFATNGDQPTAFEVSLMADAIRYEYRLEVDDRRVVYESLHSYPLGQPRRLFEREDNDIRFRRGFEGAGGIQDLLTPTTLALSAATRLRSADAYAVGRSIRSMQWLGPHFGLRRRIQSYGRYRVSASSFRLFRDEYEDPRLPGFDWDGDRPSPMELLQIADPGIDSVEFHWRDSEEPRGPSEEIRFVHRAIRGPKYSEPGGPAAGEEISGSDRALLAFEQESAGTQMWFRLIGPLLAALREGQIVLYDEIDASVHPRLSAQLVKMFQDPRTNPLGAQLIFTTHDVSLLDSLNRDEVWLVDKRRDGSSELFALAEFGGDRVRKSRSLERAYLRGRFGAVPNVDQGRIYRALGVNLERSSEHV
ncbi:MAG: AAA family ATPase [Acidimicrobiaceae bacterium]|nr:AAA family ATPase [Acidimicrobiaceae bacterium]